MSIEAWVSHQYMDVGELDRLRSQWGKAQLGIRVREWLRGFILTDVVPLPDVQHFVDKYGEQVTVNAEADIAKFFRLARGRGYTFGGVVTGIPEQLLEIQPRDALPSITALSSLGEGLAGWYLEREGWLIYGRPINETPDIIFMNREQTAYALVEVKATQGQRIDSRLREATLAVLDAARRMRLHDAAAAFECWGVGLTILPEREYIMRVLRVTLR